ncbi:MAG: hypothetical protein PHO83_06310 [Geobacteraceae bacterium]|nr:hypothetical protein [Geobacteraceae bacterium]
MTPIEKADKVLTILELVDGNVRHAYKLCSYFCRAAYKNDVKNSFDQSKAAPGYNQVVESLYFELIMTLVRLFDNLQEEKCSKNTASIPELMSLLSEPEVVAELQLRSEQRKTPTGNLEKELKSSDLGFLEKLKVKAKQSACIETFQFKKLFQDFEKLKESHFLSRLRTVRNELFAHTAIERNRNNPARYGDAEKLLEMTAQLVANLNSAIRSLHDDYKGAIKTWQEHANYFWEKIDGVNAVQ